MTTITIPVSPEIMDFLNDEALETGINNPANIVSDIILKYKRDRFLKSINEAAQECASGGGYRGNLEDLI